MTEDWKQRVINIGKDMRAKILSSALQYDPRQTPRFNYNLTDDLIKTFEDRLSANFIGEFVLLTKDGSWSYSPFAVFHRKEKDPKYGNYFIGVYVDKVVTFCDADKSMLQEPFHVAVAVDGEVIRSVNRHDFVQSKDQTVFIDGGRDYVRSNTLNTVQLIYKEDGKLYLFNSEEA